MIGTLAQLTRAGRFALEAGGDRCAHPHDRGTWRSTLGRVRCARRVRRPARARFGHRRDPRWTTRVLDRGRARLRWPRSVLPRPASRPLHTYDHWMRSVFATEAGASRSTLQAWRRGRDPPPRRSKPAFKALGPWRCATRSPRGLRTSGPAPRVPCAGEDTVMLDAHAVIPCPPRCRGRPAW
jgi:hypothetical protein